MTPYLIPDHDMITALTYAAKRGVEVIIIMPHIPDKWYAFVLAKTYYNELLDAGVQISFLALYMRKCSHPMTGKQWWEP